MAEASIVSVLSKLGSIALEEIALICGAKEDFAKLKKTFSAMQAGLRDAEQRGDQNHAVKDWLGKLKDAAYDADDLLDELSYETLRREVITRDKKDKEVRIFFSEHNQLVFAVKMVHKIKKLRQRLEDIEADKIKFGFSKTEHVQSRTKDREYTHSFVREEEVIGRDEEKEEIVKRLLEINEKQNVSVDAIVGVGGLGKTTLAQSVFNHKGVEDSFNLRLWVCISEIFDLKIIVEKIIEAATEERPSGLGIDPLQRKLRKQIDGKKYLLVIDDLWNEDGERWADLKRLLMGGAKGSKILITTRSKKVAEVSGATSSYDLNGLSESNPWKLFKQMAFKEGEEPESPNMIVIGKEIAGRCKGVPLVIRVIGRLLYFKTSEAEWLSFKDNELSTFTQQENKITQVLKLSYNHLPSHLKPCFAYCSLFPKDYKFEKDKLIRLWVAEGFVQSQGENKCLEDVGNEYFMELIWRSIFQDVQRNEYGDVVGCKMHDLAQLVAGTECFSLTSDSAIKNVNERTRRVSYDWNDKSKWSALFTSQLKPYKLRTFLSLLANGIGWNLYETGLEAYILSLKSLRVLDLKRTSMEKVFFSIGMLKHLRFLNLSFNYKIESLPSSVTKLHFLQTLHLKQCPLRELPEDIGSLVNLRHLDISGNMSMERLPDSICKLLHLQNLNLSGCSSLVELPRDISNLVNLKHLDLEYCDGLSGMPLGLNKLTGLQTMNLYVVGPSVSSEELWQLNTLCNIRGELRISDLHNLRKDSSQADTVTLRDNHGVRDLTLEWREFGCNPNDMDRDFVVLEKLHPNKNVDKLSIDGYGGVRLSNWVSSLSNLTSIFIQNCERLQYVPRFNRLPNLQNLELRKLNFIEYIDNNETVDECHSSVFFPSLESLTLSHMDKLKGWWKFREFTPKDPAQSFLLPSFHCLSHLRVVACPQMFSSPFPNSSLKTLELNYLVVSPKDYTQRCATLPEGFQHLIALHSLSIEFCLDLVMLPDWIGNLTSLHILKILYCPKLTLLPEGIHQLSSLRSLTICDCKRLEERCRLQIGEDWSKIAHVEDIKIGWQTVGRQCQP